METRVARSEDVAGAVEVWRASLAASGARPSAARTEQVHARLAASDALLVVAGAEPVRGFALGSWVRDDAGAFVPGLLRLEDLVVHPAERGAGTGAALAEGLADAGWVRGARRLVATPADDAARGFLEACGLLPVDELLAAVPQPEPEDVFAEPVEAVPAARPAGVGAEDLLADLEPPVREVVVRESGLRLGQLLKLAGLVETGAEGKALLEAGEVQVDGEVELRRGRQLRSGDVVVARDQAVRVVLPEG